MMASLSEAFVNTVNEAMMCTQSRKDPIHGSQDLISFSWFCTGIGGLFGSLIAGIVTQYYHPKYGFLMYSVMGLAVSFSGMWLTRASEEIDVEENESQDDSLSSFNTNN